MTTFPFSSKNGNCHGNITIDHQWKITVEGKCSIPGATEVKYAAAAPANLRMSYMGSGLPYPNEDVAYEGSMNVGQAPITQPGAAGGAGSFRFVIFCPNSYYMNNGSQLVEPHVHFTIGREYFDIPLPSPFKNRSLTSIAGRANRAARR